jgi:hypothetical protein
MWGGSSTPYGVELMHQAGVPLEWAHPIYGGIAGLGATAPSAWARFGRTGPMSMADELAPGVATRGVGGALPGQIGRTGEDFLHRAFGGRPASFETSQGRRFVDSFAGGVARESKVGRVSMSPRVRSQISKDLELLQTRQIDAAEFHFFRSPVTGRGGPTPSVERLLKDCGIGCVIHE